MSIQPVKTEGVALPPKAKAAPAATAKSTPATPAGDRLEIESKEHLLEAVRQEPSVRAEELERAKALASDPNYPSNDILARVAQRLLGKK